jgi:hypothetical protein
MHPDRAGGGIGVELEVYAEIVTLIALFFASYTG